MEESHLPFVLMESFREVLEVALTEVSDILQRQQALNAILLLVLLDKDVLKQQT